MGANKPIAPASLLQVGGAGRVVGKKSLELWERLWEPKIATLVNVHEHGRTLPLVAVGDNRIGRTPMKALMMFGVEPNTSGTQPAKFLVLLIKDKGAPALVPAQCGRSGRRRRWRRGCSSQRTGGHTARHGVVRLASGSDRLTFAGDAVFQVGFEHPDWYNGFEHEPEEAARVRVRLLRELAANRESLVATHLSFPSVCHVAVDGDVFRWVPGLWDY